MRSVQSFAGIALVALACLAKPALAQSTNAAPIIVESNVPVDVTKLPVGDDGKKSISDATAQMKAGTIIGALYAGSFDGRTWAGSNLPQGLAQSTSDVARQVLERCEYSAKGPCAIMMIGGHEARTPDGGWPTQPRMLRDEPGSKFDAWTVPFASIAYRSSLASYAPLASPKALAMTTAGGYYWSSGKTIFEAIDTAFASCSKTNPPANCFLYAVNDTVVFAP